VNFFAILPFSSWCVFGWPLHACHQPQHPTARSLMWILFFRPCSGGTCSGGTDRENLPLKIRNAYSWVCLVAAIAVGQVIVETEILTKAIVNQGYTQASVSGFIPRPGSEIGIVGHVTNTALMRQLKLQTFISISVQTVLYLRYWKLLTKYDTQRKGQAYMEETKWRRISGLVFDVVLGMLHIPFFWDWSFSWDTFRSYGSGDMPWPLNEATGKYSVPYHIDMLSMFLVLPFNVALLPRLVLYRSQLWTDGAALAGLAGVDVSVGVAIRAGFTRSPGRYLFFLLAFPFLTLSFIFSNCERLVNPMYGSHHHALWASYISLTTVGYGTDEAQTQCGRSISLVLIILGIMGTSMLISKVEDAMHMDRSQQTVMRMIADKERAQELQELSVRKTKRPDAHFSLRPSFLPSFSPEPVVAKHRVVIQKTKQKVPFFLSQCIAIQKCWRAYQVGGRFNRKESQYKTKAEKESMEQLEVAFRNLATKRKAPLEFDADFETRMEQTVWDLQEQVTDLKETLR
jgi:hypothetical protein